MSPAWQVDSLPLSQWGSPKQEYTDSKTFRTDINTHTQTHTKTRIHRLKDLPNTHTHVLNKKLKTPLKIGRDSESHSRPSKLGMGKEGKFI